MKIVTIFGYLLLGLMIYASLWLLFDLEFANVGTALLLLVLAQLRYLVSKIRVKGAAPPPQVDASHVAGLLKEIKKKQGQLPAQGAGSSLERSAAQSPAKSAAKGRGKSPTPAALDSGSSEGIDPNLFSRFQKNLDEQSAEREEPAPTSTPDDDVVVQISGQAKGRNPYQKVGTKKPEASKPEPPKPEGAKSDTPKSNALKSDASAPLDPKELKSGLAASEKGGQSKQAKENSLIDQIDVEPLGSLFDGEMEEEAELMESAKVIQPKSRKKGVSQEPPLEAKEILTSEDLELPATEIKEDQKTLLETAKKKLEENPEGALKTLQGLAAKLDLVEDPAFALQVLQAKAQAEFATEAFSANQKTHEKIFKKLTPKSDPEFLPSLERVMDQYIKANQQQHALHFLFTALREYKDLKDYRRMDVTYYHIEEGYRRLEDADSLAKTYKNHLIVKSELGDEQGQLPILDHLGKLLYDQGDQEGSKECYEKAVKIKEAQ